jgi:hypothetical protein
VIVYLFFGRSRKAFSKRETLWRQNLQPTTRPLVVPLLSHQDAEIARIEGKSASLKKLLLLVRRTSPSALSTRNELRIEQNAAELLS